VTAQLWVTLAVALGSLILGAGGLAGFLMIPAQRRRMNVDADSIIIERAVALTTPYEEHAKRWEDRARRLDQQLDAAESKAEEAERKWRAVSAEATRLANYLRWVVDSIHNPAMDIERLRVLVPPQIDLPPANGRAIG